MNKTQLLNRVAQSAEERQLLARVCDQMDHAARGVPACTPFLSLAQQEAATRLIAAAGYPRHLFSGGFADAERKVCAFLPDWQEEDDWENPFALVRCQWQSGEKLTHRDFLGATLGLGLDREKVGDILVGEGSADLVVFAELAPFLVNNLTGAGRAKLRVSQAPLSQLTVPEKQVKVIHDTVSSLRLDAVMSTGFSMARGKAASLISAGKVELNHRPCVKSDRGVEQGDVISCRGFGKCVLTQAGGVSKKGRIIIEMERYL